ncbi:MAG: Ig-like domain-containing protein, partial [Christensenellaceae bacterium]|nr:Ig-like domain-containing protein [Christensenellaceae bacterium]
MRKSIIAVVVLIIAVCLLSACVQKPAEESVSAEKLTVAAESIKLDKTSMKVYIGEPAQLIAVLQPQETTDIPSYSSSDESIVTVDKHGNIEALAEGSAVITAKVGALKATCRVTAEYPPIDKIGFSAQEASLKVSETMSTEIVLQPENAKPEEFIYSSADEHIATVDEYGVVTAVGVGNTCIYAELKSDDSIRCMLDLTTTCDRITGIDIEEPYYSLLADGQRTIPLTVEPFGMPVQDIVWTSSDESVATVDQDGMVTAHSRGKTTITATAGDCAAECIVAVVKRLAPDPLSEIKEGRYTEQDGMLVSKTSEENGEARIMLIGDLMCLSAQQNAARSDGKHNFNSSFELVKNIFAQSDFCMGNMETLVSYSNSYAAESKEVNGNPNCNAPATYLDGLKHAGLDALILANNHCADGGET